MYLRGVFLKNKSNRIKGFTLIELLVSIGVMSIVLGVTMSGGPQAIARLALADDTSKTELLLREVQLQGSSINSVNNTFGGAGLFLDRATSTTVLKFKDRAIADVYRFIDIGDGLYSSAPVNEMESIILLAKRNRISKLCVATTSPSVFYCNAENTTIGTINTLTVSFNRPKQEAHMYINNSTTTDFSAACIQLDAPNAPGQGYTRAIFVYKSGMITKKVAACN
jgi:prepilin-type N-terminal cleavage/methylation domain-containing protein